MFIPGIWLVSTLFLQFFCGRGVKQAVKQEVTPIPEALCSRSHSFSSPSQTMPPLLIPSEPYRSCFFTLATQLPTPSEFEDIHPTRKKKNHTTPAEKIRVFGVCHTDPNTLVENKAHATTTAKEHRDASKT